MSAIPDGIALHLEGYERRMERLAERAQAGPPRPAVPRASIEAASTSPRMAGWPAHRSSLNQQLARQGGDLRARVRDACINSPYLVNARDQFGADHIATGIVPSPRTRDEDLNERVKEEFLAWTNYADADGLLDYYGQQALGSYELFEAGEYFIRFRPRRPEDGFDIPLQVQLLPSEMLPYDRTECLPNGNIIRMGIEFDLVGRRVAYHFWREHPGDLAWGSGRAGETVRVPADQIRHVYDPRRIGQVRGLPRPTAALTRDRMRGDYEDAELERKRAAACHVAAVSDDDDIDDSDPIPGMADPGDPAGGAGVAPATGHGEPHVEISPGMSSYIGRRKVTFNNPPDSGPNYEQFDRRTLLAEAAGIGMPYVHVTGDTLAANYSNSRMSRLIYKPRVEMLQHHVMVQQHCRPVWEQWVRAAALSGRLGALSYQQMRDLQLRVDHRPCKWDYIDPKKDIGAEIDAINAGIDSRSAAIERRGEEPAEVDRRRAADRDRERRHGLERQQQQQQRPQPQRDPPPGPGWR